MAKVKLTKTELKAQKDALARYRRFLPMLQLKKSQLQMELGGMRAREADLARREEELLDAWVQSLPAPQREELSALYREMEAQETAEAKVYKALDKLEAVIQHNEAPLATWSENEYELNKTYANDAVAFSPWLRALRAEVLKDTLEKIENESSEA